MLTDELLYYQEECPRTKAVFAQDDGDQLGRRS